MAGHLLAACLQYGQVLASAVSRLVSAAAVTPLCSPLISPSLPPDRCSHTTTTTSQLFMGPACFDFKYLPRRRLLCSGLSVCVCVCMLGGWWCRFCNLKHTQTFSLCMNMYTYEHTHTHTPVRAEVEGWFVLFSSRQSD